MFYDSGSMKDIIESSFHKTDWDSYLVIGEFFGRENADNLLLSSFLEQWRVIIRESLNDEDAAHPLNRGNILVLVHKKNQNQFTKTVGNTFITSSENTSGLRSSIVSLRKEDLNFLMTLF